MMIGWKLVLLTCSLGLTCTLADEPGSSTSWPTTSTPDVEEPTTLLFSDSLSVNADETPRTIVVDDDRVASGEEASLPGVEAKSISASAPNSLSDARPDEPSGKLVNVAPSVEASPPEGELDSSAQTTRPPQARLNVSQMNQIYNQPLRDEKETVESWQRMGKKLKKGIGNVIGSLVPYALNMSQEARISSNCSGAMLKWVLSMNQLKSWALRMLDASGKPIAGLLEGSLTMFGNYRECLKIRAPDDDEIEFSGQFHEYFRGKYCIVQAKPWLPEKSRFYNLNTKLKGLMQDENEDEPTPWYEKTVFDELSEWALAFNFVNIRMDVCVPSLCTIEDLNKAINFLLRGIDLKARILRCEQESKGRRILGAASAIELGSSDDRLGVLSASTVQGDSGSSSEVASAYSSVDQPSTNPLTLILGWLLVPAAAIVLVLLATLVSFALGDRDEVDLMDESDIDTSAASNQGFGSSSRLGSKSRIDLRMPNKLSRTINSLSLKRSVSSHLNVDYDQLADDKPLALYGIRFVLVLWVILVESAVNLKFEYLRELLMLKDLIFWWPMQLVINSSLQFDSFILLTAFTMSYKNVLNEPVKGIKNITRFVVDKYIRLMPSIMIMVALVILMPLIYSGPVWNDYVTKQSAVCQSTGWLNAVFLQNYLAYNEICLPQTWLLCVEFQLVLLMAPIVYYLNKCYLNNLERNKMIGFLASSSGSNKLGESRRSNGDANKPFFWTRTMPGVLLIVCIVLGLSASFYNVYMNQLPPSWFYTMADPDSKAIYFGQHMMRLWTHLAVFAMGILAGVECRRASRNVQRGYRGLNLAAANESRKIGHPLKHQNKSQSSSSSSLPVTVSRDSGNSFTNELSAATGSSISINILNTPESSSSNYDVNQKSEKGRCCASLLIDVIGCLVAVLTMAAIIFSTHDWSLNDLPEPLIAGTFDAASRFLWSLATIWILYLISVPDKDKKFSALSRALGHPFMVSLGKLSFLIYVIHPIVHTAVLAIQEQPIYSSWLMLFHILIGNMTITVILASLVSLFVEMPCRNLFRRCGTSLLLSHSLETAPTITRAATAAANPDSGAS